MRPITHRGLTPLALPSIQQVSLQQTKIHDQGFESLTRLLDAQESVEYINLITRNRSWLPVDDEGQVILHDITNGHTGALEGLMLVIMMSQVRLLSTEPPYQTNIS